jgi:hypothetical protein
MNLRLTTIFYHVLYLVLIFFFNFIFHSQFQTITHKIIAQKDSIKKIYNHENEKKKKVVTVHIYTHTLTTNPNFLIHLLIACY